MPEPHASPLFRGEKRAQLRALRRMPAKHDSGVKRNEFDEIARKIEELLQENSISVPTLCEQLEASWEKEHIQQVLHYLLSEEKWN